MRTTSKFQIHRTRLFGIGPQAVEQSEFVDTANSHEQADDLVRVDAYKLRSDGTFHRLVCYTIFNPMGKIVEIVLPLSFQ